MQLSQAAITQASIEILDEFGLGDMTMRRLATRLKVAPGALYWHFENKQALIAATARHIVQPLLADAASPQAAAADFLSRCTKLRSTLWEHRDGGELLSAALMNNDLRQELLGFLQGGFDSNIPQDLAATAANTALYFIVGSTVVAQTQAQLAAVNAAAAAAKADSQKSEDVNTTTTKPANNAENAADSYFFQGIELIQDGVTQKTS